jgi:hypothetical protein
MAKHWTTSWYPRLSKTPKGMESPSNRVGGDECHLFVHQSEQGGAVADVRTGAAAQNADGEPGAGECELEGEEGNGGPAGR